jgi:hypothetical protein
VETLSDEMHIPEFQNGLSEADFAARNVYVQHLLVVFSGFIGISAWSVKRHEELTPLAT